MPIFSRRSREALLTCDSRLIALFTSVINSFDCTVLEGHRGEDQQNELFRRGASGLEWPLSRHNKEPSQAADVCPYPIDWLDYRRHYLFAGIVLGHAQKMGIVIRWGGDWNRDTQIKDNTFNDLVHFELYDG